MKDQASDKRSSVIIFALILTCAFLGLFAWLLSRTKTCPDGWWLWQRLDCLEPNALGDTFAGAFAPVAFVWLVAAVLLQRNELAAQRQELRESRQVAAQQVDEARKNVRLIEVQTQIFEQDRARNEIKEIDSDIDELVGTLAQSLPEALCSFRMSGGYIDLNFRNDDEFRFEFDDQTYHVDQVRMFLKELKNAHAYLLLHVEQTGEIHFVEASGMTKISEALKEIEELAENASRPKRAQLTLDGYFGAAISVRKFYLELVHHGTEDFPTVM